MRTDKIVRLVTAALLAALTCVATAILPISITGTSGYIHPGDAFVILSGILLGPFYGGLAAGIGSMFADLYVGYAFFYVTLLVKLLAAIAAVLTYRHIKSYRILLSGIAASLVVTVGYFIFETFMFGFAASIVSLPFNLIQNAFSIVLSSILLPLLKKVPQIRNMMDSY